MTSPSGRSHVLMVAYYFPPIGMGGVQRPLKFARYLPEFGWDVTVLAPGLRSYPATDETLLRELPDSVNVIRVPARHPMQHSFAHGIPGSRHRWLRSLLPLFRWPDDKRGFVRPALRAASALNSGHPIDVVWTTSPPPSAHLAGLRVKNQFRTGWVADFRDPWFVRFDDFGPTRGHKRYAESLRKEITAGADRLVAASQPIATSLDALSPKYPTEVIHNGYDERDFTGVTRRAADDQPLTILLYGTMGENPDAGPLFHLLREWKTRHPSRDFRLIHVGMSVHDDLDVLAARYELSDRFQSLGYQPHLKSVSELISADVVVLPMSAKPGHENNLPGRVFELMRSLRPVLALAHATSEVARILHPVPGCWIVPQHNIEAGIAALNQVAGLPRGAPVRDLPSIARFERREQSRQLASLFDAIKRTSPV